MYVSKQCLQTLALVYGTSYQITLKQFGNVTARTVGLVTEIARKRRRWYEFFLAFIANVYDFSGDH